MIALARGVVASGIELVKALPGLLLGLAIIAIVFAALGIDDIMDIILQNIRG